MSGYLIYHPKRDTYKIKEKVIYHDSIKGNQDPYIWNKEFLHTYCHITQMKPSVGDINFWVSGDTFPNFKHLFCDLVFVVGEKSDWEESNNIEKSDRIVDSIEAYNDHYRWFAQHHYKKRKRYTLKADPEKSFQPQNQNGELLDIVPILEKMGLSLENLHKSMKAGFASKPLKLSKESVDILFEWMNQNAVVKLHGKELYKIRKNNNYFKSTDSKTCSKCT